jgi:hypothetical protein
MMLQGLFNYLTDDTGVKALISNRLFPLLAKQGTAFPYAVYSVISAERVHSDDGPALNAMPRVQIDCYGRTYGQAREVFEAMRTALDGFSGFFETNDSPPEQVNIQAVELLNESDFIEEEGDKRIFRVSADFWIMFDE